MSVCLSLCGWPTSDDLASAGFSFLDCRMTPEVPLISKSCMILWLKHLVTAIFFEAQKLFLLNFAFPDLSLKVDHEPMARQVSCWSTVLGSKQSKISATQFWAPKAWKGCLSANLTASQQLKSLYLFYSIWLFRCFFTCILILIIIILWCAIPDTTRVIR